MGRARLTGEEAIDRLKNRSIKLEKYCGTAGGISLFKCLICGYVWNAKFSQINAGVGCLKCSGKFKLTEKECHEKLLGRPLKVKKYAGSVGSIKSIFECSACKHNWSTSFNSVCRGHGCPKCFNLKRKKLKCIKEGEAIKRLASRTIKLIDYGGSTISKSVFRCDICDYKWTTTFNKVDRGRGCPRCSGRVRLTEEECKHKLKGRSVSLVHYSDKSSSKSKFKCNLCSLVWESNIHNILNNKGCPKCTKYGFDPSKPAWLYVILLSTVLGSCYGFGITKDIKTRMGRHKIYLRGMIDYEYPPQYFDSGEEAKKVESVWKKSTHTVDIGIKGFRTECVLVNSETTKMIFG